MPLLINRRIVSSETPINRAASSAFISAICAPFAVSVVNMPKRYQAIGFLSRGLVKIRYFLDNLHKLF